MAVVALGSLRSCGVTTAALALATSWPTGRRVLLVEVDPAGGTLAASLGLPPEPGLVSLAAATRRPLEASTDPSVVIEHAQTLTDNTSILVAPPSGEQARQTSALLEPLLGGLEKLEIDVLLDCGRLDRASPAASLFAAAALPVLLIRAQLADLHTAASSLDCLAGGERAVLVLIGDAAYPPSEVAAALGRETLGTIPDDRGGATRISSDRWHSRVARTPLLRNAASLASVIAERLDRAPTFGSVDTVPSWNGHR
jgi:hypothetical protein